MTKDEVKAIAEMTKSHGWAVFSNYLRETLAEVEKIILNGLVPEGEMPGFIARRWFLLYVL
jgi:hypothetical protein